MAARLRTRSASQTLFAGPSGGPLATHTTSNTRELYNITSFDVTYNYETEPISIFGTLAPVTREALNPPTVEFNADYYLTNFDNENRMGLVVNGLSGAFSKIINGQEDEKNYFLMVAADGTDAIGASPAITPCIGFGNAALSSYSATFEVGSYPTVSVGWNALNARAYSDSLAESLPAIDPTTGLEVTSGTFSLPVASGNVSRDAVIRPWDVQVNFGGLSGVFYDMNQACVQSASISLDLGREPINCLGNRFSKARDITFPVDVTLETSFRATDLTPGSLTSLSCGTGTYNATLTCYRPACPGSTGTLALKYDLRGLRFVSQNETTALGTEGKTVTTTWVTSLGSANDTGVNLIMSGAFTP